MHTCAECGQACFCGGDIDDIDCRGIAWNCDCDCWRDDDGDDPIDD